MFKQNPKSQETSGKSRWTRSARMRSAGIALGKVAALVVVLQLVLFHLRLGYFPWLIWGVWEIGRRLCRRAWGLRIAVERSAMVPLIVREDFSYALRPHPLAEEQWQAGPFLHRGQRRHSGVRFYGAEGLGAPTNASGSPALTG